MLRRRGRLNPVLFPLLLVAGCDRCRDEPPPPELPPVRVTHIEFDHTGPDASVSDALNIRQSFAADLQHAGNGAGAGEWIDGQRNEPALYVANQRVTVRARLTADPGITSADISATAIGELRNLTVQTVAFTNGISDPEYVTFTPDGPTGTAMKKVEASWQWVASNIRRGANAQPGPTNITRSGPHTIYTVLDVPRLPWYKPAVDATHPWVDALEFALTTAGANGKASLTDAASQFTTFLHSAYGLSYDSRGEGSPKYYERPRVQLFDLTAYMTRANGAVVACEDQAAGVHTLLNLMGAASEFVDRRIANANLGFGYIHPATLVGGVRTNNPFHAAPGYDPRPLVGLDALINDANGDGLRDRSGFSFHTFVRLNGNIYDATLGPALGQPEAAWVQATIDTSTGPERQVTVGALVFPYPINIK